MLDDMPSLAGLRLLIADSDAARAAEIAGSLAALGATVEATRGVNPALDLLESADPGFDGLLVADRLIDGAGVTLARAVRTSMLAAEPRLVRMDHGVAGEDFDAWLLWPAGPEAIVAALSGGNGSSAAEGEASDLDLAELEAIAGELTEDLLAMLRRFVALAEELVAAIGAAIAEGRSEDALAHAHSLKGSAFSAGAIRLGRAARDLESAVKEERLEPMAHEQLKDATRCLADAINALRLAP
jgi:HPt (histidine-containing phosphotransfer) domain-containing protein